MSIKMIPHFATSDGALHTDLDKAAEHERVLIVQDLLLMNRSNLGLSLDEIEKQARVACALKDDLSKAFSADLKRGLHSGGIVRSPGTSYFGTRLAEGIERERPAIPPAKRTKDAAGATVYVGDTVHPVEALEPDSRTKWGETNQTVGAIHDDGSIVLKETPGFRWHPSSFRRGADKLTADLAAAIAKNTGAA